MLSKMCTITRQTFEKNTWCMLVSRSIIEAIFLSACHMSRNAFFFFTSIFHFRKQFFCRYMAYESEQRYLHDIHLSLTMMPEAVLQFSGLSIKGMNCTEMAALSSSVLNTLASLCL